MNKIFNASIKGKWMVKQSWDVEDAPPKLFYFLGIETVGIILLIVDDKEKGEKAVEIGNYKKENNIVSFYTNMDKTIFQYIGKFKKNNDDTLKTNVSVQMNKKNVYNGSAILKKIHEN